MKTGSTVKEQEPFSARNKPVFDTNISRKFLEGNFTEEVTCEMGGLTFQPIRKHKPGQSGEFWNGNLPA